ncbi:CapA family protein [Allorhizocola rhizosphaerae]|uniref:CapA family protein n=1 Tax=Allorhizocola rhizosphaerae TaxID=1872709 RepID=UPI001FE346EB|nr:CapA family protein [Allorhizocola rhizosphaerae]
MRRLAIAGALLGLAACTHAAMSAPQPTTSFTLVATGDFMSQPPLAEQAAAEGGFDGILGALKPLVQSADVAICHVETPVAAPGESFTGYPIMNAPRSLLETAARLGYDSCSTASNHVLDYGQDGVARTLDTLDRVGIKHAGSARSEQEASTPTIVEAKGVKIGHLSYTFSFNGIDPPHPWSANLIDVPRILVEASNAKRSGAEVTVVSMHWGTEYQHEPDIGQIGLAHELLASPDIDLVIGTHVHVVQPLERIGEEWVHYGMGNILVRFPDGSPENTQDATASRFTFHKTEAGWRVSKVEVVPTWMEYYPSGRVVDLPAELARGANDTYQRAHERIVGWVTARGAQPQIIAAS